MFGIAKVLENQGISQASVCFTTIELSFDVVIQLTCVDGEKGKLWSSGKSVYALRLAYDQ